jgi:hypothetical protein
MMNQQRWTSSAEQAGLNKQSWGCHAGQRGVCSAEQATLVVQN